MDIFRKCFYEISVAQGILWNSICCWLEWANRNILGSRCAPFSSYTKIQLYGELITRWVLNDHYIRHWNHSGTYLSGNIYAYEAVDVVLRLTYNTTSWKWQWVYFVCQQRQQNMPGVRSFKNYTTSTRSYLNRRGQLTSPSHGHFDTVKQAFLDWKIQIQQPPPPTKKSYIILLFITWLLLQSIRQSIKNVQQLTSLARQSRAFAKSITAAAAAPLPTYSEHRG